MYKVKVTIYNHYADKVDKIEFTDYTAFNDPLNVLTFAFVSEFEMLDPDFVREMYSKETVDEFLEFMKQYDVEFEWEIKECTK